MRLKTSLEYQQLMDKNFEKQQGGISSLYIQIEHILKYILYATLNNLHDHELHSHEQAYER